MKEERGRKEEHIDQEELKQKALELKREYKRKWLKEYRKKHPEKFKKYDESYWIKKAKQLLEHS